MSDVPDEFKERARDLLAFGWPPEGGSRSWVLYRTIIARALMAERKKALEEAAKVAESYGDTWSGTRDATQACQEAAADEKVEEIAAAIRKLAEG